MATAASGGGGAAGVTSARSRHGESDGRVSVRGFLLGLAVPASVAGLQQMALGQVFMGHALFVAVVFCGAAVAVMHSQFQGRKIQVSGQAAGAGAEVCGDSPGRRVIDVRCCFNKSRVSCRSLD